MCLFLCLFTYNCSFTSINQQTPAPSGRTYKDKCRLAAFGPDVARTMDFMVPGDVIDIINPSIVRPRPNQDPKYNKEITIPYELRINAHTQVTLFRQDERNIATRYVTYVDRYPRSVTNSVTVGHVLIADPSRDKDKVVQITARLKKVLPIVLYDGMY